MVSYARRFWPRSVTGTVLTVAVALVLLRWLAGGLGGGEVAYEDDDFVPPQIDFPGYAEFAKGLKEAASEDGTVVIAVVDYNYVSLALNFYASSIKRHGVGNMVYVSLDQGTCDALAGAFPETRRRCFLYTDVSSPELLRSKSFKEKTHLRRFFILEALKLRHNVLVVDVDVVFLENPLGDVRKACGKCDVAIMWDDHQENYDGGLVYARATDRTIAFYNRLAAYELSHGSGRLALNAALKESKKRAAPALKVEALSKKKYRIGIEFFQRNRCPEKKAYRGVLAVHNNYIMEAHNKVFRLKECGLWQWDGLDGYYTNTSRRYLTVDAPGPRGYPEHQSLLNAFSLARLLRRTVVLPALECRRGRCSLLTRMYDHSHVNFIRRFDAATGGDYRESTFLQHAMVPASTKDSVSPIFHIAFRGDRTKTTSRGEPVRHLVPKDLSQGPTVREVFGWLAGRPERVLRFDSLTGWFAHIKHADILGEELVKVIRQL